MGRPSNTVPSCGQSPRSGGGGQLRLGVSWVGNAGAWGPGEAGTWTGKGWPVHMQYSVDSNVNPDVRGPPRASYFPSRPEGCLLMQWSEWKGAILAPGGRGASGKTWRCV